MTGPYFEGQQPNECGCFYPDSIRVWDEGLLRWCFCIEHGLTASKIKREESSPERMDLVDFDTIRLKELCGLVG